MILPDTSSWVEHFKSVNERLASALMTGHVVLHDFVQGELLCGGIRPGTEHWVLLQTLTKTATVPHDEVVEFFLTNRLQKTGLGWTDVHLLAAASLEGHAIVTEDRSLATIAARLDCLA